MELCAHESIISFPRVLAALSGSSGHEVAAIEGSAVPSAFLVASTQAMGPHKALLIVSNHGRGWSRLAGEGTGGVLAPETPPPLRDVLIS